MSSKCEWKNSEFSGCTGFSKAYEDMRMQRIEFPYEKYSFCPFCGASLKKPVEIKAGMFGKFCDARGLVEEWGVLFEVMECLPYKYVSGNEGGSVYEHFSPGLPTGFNKNGEPVDD